MYRAGLRAFHTRVAFPPNIARMSSEQSKSPTSMRAWTYSSAANGLEKSLRLTFNNLPIKLLQPPKDKLLVEVVSMALNPTDYKTAESPFMSRIPTSKPASPGYDFCGRVVHKDGKLVFGRLDWVCQHGALGQYVLTGQNDMVDLPTSLDVNDAAAVSTAALTAYQTVVPFVRKGDCVFINGGSGGVGTFSIQIAKLLGYYVLVSYSARNVGLYRGLGADETIDYTKVDLAAELSRRDGFDMVLDNVGDDKSFHRKPEAFLKPVGIFVLVSAVDQDLSGVCSMLESWLRPTWLGGPRRRWKYKLCRNDRTQLQQISDWLAEGKLKVVVDEVFKFDDALEAIEKLKNGRARGKIVVSNNPSLETPGNFLSSTIFRYDEV